MLLTLRSPSSSSGPTVASGAAHHVIRSCGESATLRTWTALSARSRSVLLRVWPCSQTTLHARIVVSRAGARFPAGQRLPGGGTTLHRRISGPGGPTPPPSPQLGDCTSTALSLARPARPEDCSPATPPRAA